MVKLVCDWCDAEFTARQRRRFCSRGCAGRYGNERRREMGWPHTRIPMSVRFERYVDRRGPDECWPWTGNRDSPDGYGRIHAGGRGAPTYRAHRVAWEFANGRPVPTGQRVIHICGNAGCVNPAHLELATHSEAMEQAHRRGAFGEPLRGDRNPRTRFSDQTVRRMRELRVDGWLVQDIAALYGAGISTVEGIVTGNRRPHAPGPITRLPHRGRGRKVKLTPYAVEQACALRDEGERWEAISEVIGHGGKAVAAIKRAVGERAPELVEMDRIALARRHRDRERFWADILINFPLDDEDAELRRQAQGRRRSRTLAAA
jgi:hypothetical protein